MPSAGWATRVSVSAACCGAPAVRSKAAGGKSSVGAAAAELEVAARSSGKATNRSAEHAGALAALPGEEERHLAGRRRVVRPVGWTRPPARGSCSPASARCTQRSSSSVRSRATDRDLGRRRAGSAGAAAATDAASCAQPRAGRSRRSASPARLCQQLASTDSRRGGRGRAPRKRTAPPARRPLRVPAARRVRRRRCSTTWKLVPPKPNALTPAIRSRGRHRPRAGLGVERERAVLRRPRPGWAVRRCRVGGRTPVCSGERRLDQPGQPGGALGVPDLRLHRAERAAARLGAGLGEHPVSVLQLGAVADHRAGAVRLDQPDLGAARSPARR